MTNYNRRDGSRKRRGAKDRNRKLAVERLDPRLPMDAALSDLLDVTISFAPDGTDVDGHRSKLFAELNQIAPPADWQGIFVQAFETWSQLIGAHVRIVADQGTPFGADGAAHADPRFGDVRIAALPLMSDVVAISAPRLVPAATWAGDILFNSDTRVLSREELFAVALHEAGHVFGLGHSDDPNSPMFSHGLDHSIIPTPTDIVLLRQLYGEALTEDSSTSAIPLELESENSDDNMAETIDEDHDDDDDLHDHQQHDDDDPDRSQAANQMDSDDNLASAVKDWQPLVESSISPQKTPLLRLLHVTQPELVQFVLSAKNERSQDKTIISITIQTLQKQLVRKLVSRTGETLLAGTMLLEPGDYLLGIEASRTDGDSLSATEIALYGRSLTLPIGPGLANTTNSPIVPSIPINNNDPYSTPPASVITEPVIHPQVPYISLTSSFAPRWWLRWRQR